MLHLSKTLMLLPVTIFSACATFPIPQLVDGKLKACPNRPNCVSSETNQLKAKVLPIEFQSSPKVAWKDLKRVIVEIGGEIRSEEDHYLWATFTSRLFRFVDDMECRLVATEKIIHLRSASRTGYSDLGANRKRVERLRKRFEALDH